MGNSLAFSMMDVLLKGVNCDSELREKIVKGIAGFGRKFITVATDHVLGGASAEIVDELASGPDADYATEIMNLKEKFQNAIDAVLQKSEDNGRYIYEDMLTVNPKDVDGSAEKIAAMVKDAREKVVEVLKM